MASTKSAYVPTPASLSTRRGRPWLLSSNRKLRNLTSLSLRNLSLETPSHTRRRGKTIDDDALPQTLQSPAKLVALREQRGLEHSRSSDDLKALVENESAIDSVSPLKGKSKAVGDAGTPTRPVRRMRRRSTLEWANATPQKKQERLEGVTAERMADVFFSLHVTGLEEPVYVSETVERTMNPTFRNIDFSACGPGITRLGHLTVKVWVKRVKRQWKQVLELELSLHNMPHLGKSLDDLHYRLSQNAIIFHLTDGIYTAFTSLTEFIPPPAAPIARQNSTRTLPTASFDALLRLSKLDDSIQDALTTRNKLAAGLETLFEANKVALSERDHVAEAEDRLKTIDYAKKTVEKQLEKAHKQTAERRESLQLRRKLMSQDFSNRKTEQEYMLQVKPELPHYRDEREIRKKAIHSQRRRICEDLQSIYPITPVPKQSLAFRIRSLHLPNSDDLDNAPIEEVAAALGHASHIVLLLSYYLSQPLPYPLDPRGSSSTINDPISLLKTTTSTTERYKDHNTLRTYPLFQKGVPRFRFEYAVFLLNKDIQILLESGFNIRVLDVRQTLPNLKYLIYVATAGEGELPARKAGGVRGLMKAKTGGGITDRSREGNVDSMGSTLVGSVHGAQQANGKPKGADAGAVESLRRNIGPAGGKGSGRLMFAVSP